MALCFAVRHRTPVVEDDGPRVEAQDLDGTAFLPSPREVADLRDRMAIVVQRILVHHLPELKPLEAFVPTHISHRFSGAMREASKVINLGVVDADPSSTAGTIHIMTHLQDYVPLVGDQVHRLPCNGDGLSVERMIHAQRARVRGHTLLDRLGGLVPTPQEFHKEGILLQVVRYNLYNLFYTGNSPMAGYVSYIQASVLGYCSAIH